MIRLTRANGKTLYINPQHLIEVGHDEDYKQTLVRTMAEGWYVLESPEEVMRKVLEWQIKTNRVQALAQKWAQVDDKILLVSYQLEQWESTLYELAGLMEEPNHD